MTFVRVNQLEQFLELWPFLLEGLEPLNASCGGRREIAKETYFKILLQAALGRPDLSLLGLMVDDTGKPLCYGVVLENTPMYAPKTLLCYAVYSNGNNHLAVRKMLRQAEKWAKQHGYVEIQAASRRFSGAVTRLFERQWEFEKDCIVFRKRI